MKRSPLFFAITLCLHICTLAQAPTQLPIWNPSLDQPFQGDWLVQPAGSNEATDNKRAADSKPVIDNKPIIDTRSGSDARPGIPKASVYRSADGKQIILFNGLLKRSFALQPDAV